MRNTFAFDDYDLGTIRCALNEARRVALDRYKKHLSLAHRSCTSEFADVNKDLAMDAHSDAVRYEKLLAKINTL